MALPKLNRPLVFVDLETTGTDLTRDRIVEVALVRLAPDASRVEVQMRINPGMPIPEQSTRIHGIKDSDVKGAPRFAEVAAQLRPHFVGADLAGHSVRKFDLPMLHTEFERAGLESPFDDVRVVDTYEIFQRLVSHSLEGALRFFCGKEHKDKHTAMGDVLATMEVLAAQLEKHPELPQDVEGLHGLAPEPQGRFVDPAGKLVKNANGEYAINFGKYKGRTLKQLLREDEKFLRWMLGKEFHPKVVEQVRKTLDSVVAVKLPLENIKLKSP
ncbi:MAG: 3'-5' exonuclease [Myxococcota bacterium]